MNPWVFEAHSEADTDRLGRALSEALPDESVIALLGTLGAGKTRLVRAVAMAEGVEPRDVVSPTFVLIQEYHARRPIYHIDAYRLHDEDEFLELGSEEYFESHGLTFIEWADRVATCLPNDRLEIRIHITDTNSRRFAFTAHGPRSESALAGLRKKGLGSV